MLLNLTHGRMLFDSKGWCCSLPTNLDWWLVHHTEITATHRCVGWMDSPMATRFLGEVLFGNFSRKKTWWQSKMHDKKTEYFKFSIKQLIYIYIWVYFPSIISWSSLSLNYNEKPKDTTTGSSLPWGTDGCLQVPGFAAPWHPGASHGRMQVAGFEGKPQVPLVPVGWQWNLLGCTRKLGSMVKINGLFHLLINGVLLAVITHWS